MPTATSLLMSSITSSPIAPPPDRNRPSPSTPSRTPSLELSPSPTAPGLVGRRKRRAEDYTQFTKGTSERFKLRKTDAAELQIFANYGLVQQNIVIAAGIFKIREQQEAMNPPDVLYSIPKKIASKIDAFTFSILLNPALNAYLENPKDPKAGPMPILMGVLRANPNWGATPTVLGDQTKLEAIEHSIAKKFTNRRYDIKTKISESMGRVDPADSEKRIDALPITDLCRSISTLYARVNLSFTPQLCARIAFLRFVLYSEMMEGGVLRKFWSTVDNELAAVRKMKAAKASKYFVTIVKQDRIRFGGTQAELNAFIEESAQDGSGENRDAGHSTEEGENEGDTTKD